MAASRIVLLSDVHIGTNAPTNWYQRDLHEPHLLAIIEYALARADEIAEFIFLGDLLDQWTYLPGTRPPSAREIAAANPRLFAPGEGALPRLAAAMPGRLSYVPGNHDMAVRNDDLASLFGAGAGGVRLAPGPLYAPPAGRGRVACTHGHIYSMFNAPDPEGDKFGGLPLGHFVTRLSALYASKQLKPGQTVADLAASGDPTALALLGDATGELVRSFLRSDESLSRLMIRTLLDAVAEGPDLPIALAGGGQTTAGAAADAYAGLFERWKDERAFSRQLYGRDPGIIALSEVDLGNDLSHFAGVLGASYDVVVMGHTHAPVDSSEHPLLVGQSLYANSGFGCPSRPDLGRADAPARVTFVEVETAGSDFTACVRYVKQDGVALGVAAEPLWPAKTTPRRAAGGGPAAPTGEPG